MSKRGFNEAERFVIKNWSAAYELEQSMEATREKYEQLWERLVEDFVESNPTYDHTEVRAVQISGNQPGQILFSKQNWAKNGRRNVSGIWIENIRLEHVAEEDLPPPMLSVWIGPLKERGQEFLEQAKRRIATEAAAVLPSTLQSKAAKSYPDSGYAIAYEFASKKEFLESLADGDEKAFVDLIWTPLDALVKLTPILDEILKSPEMHR